MKPRTLYDKIWDDHVVDDAARRHLPPLYRPPPRPRGDEPAGLRGPAPRRPQGARARKRRSPSSTTTCRRPTAPSASPIRKAASRSRRSPRTPQISASNITTSSTPPGHRPHHRPRAGLHAARHDDRLRRQPYLDAWRLRRARAWHRHVGGRARARHADADPEQSQEHARHASTARLPPGVTAKDIILAIIGEIGTAGGTGHVIEYAGEAIRALVDGRPHDRLQHVDRGRRARRHDRAGREDLRLPEGPAESAEGPRLGRRACAIGRRCTPTTARISTARSCSTPRSLPPIVTWGTSPEDVVAIERRRARPRGSPTSSKRVQDQRALEYMGLKGGDENHRHQARPRVHRLLHQRPHRGPARRGKDRRGQARVTTASTRWSCRARAW